jgi:hypothetical protein
LSGDLVFVEKFGFCKVIDVLAQQELDVIFRIQVYMGVFGKLHRCHGIVDALFTFFFFNND